MVDDGSTDQSQEIYEKSLAEVYPFTYTRHSSGPLGYGKTILTLFQKAIKDYDILITFDADLQHAPFSIKDIPHFHFSIYASDTRFAKGTD